MRKIVVDTSVAIKWFFPENSHDKALKLKNDHLAGKIMICTRDLLLYEFTSSLKNYSPLKIEEKDFNLAASTLQSLRLKICPLEYQELNELFKLSRKLMVSIYDCSYLLLAQKLRTSLYTADKKLFLASKAIISPFFV